MSKKRVDATTRAIVAERSRFLCEYCLTRQDFSTVDFSIEHIIPVASGGTDDVDNLAYSCQQCNNHKFTHTHAIDPETQVSVPLYNPRRDEWTAHFVWSADFCQIVGVSSTGRATIHKLRLNRTGTVNLRRVLYKEKKHPPGFTQIRAEEGN
jgi:hypothetical protein